MTANNVTDAPGWRWRKGMSDTRGNLVVEVDGSGIPLVFINDSGKLCEYYDDIADAREYWAYARPDLTDPATIGWLLALVREAYCKRAKKPDPTPAWIPFRDLITP